MTRQAGFQCRGTGGTGRSLPADEIEAKVDAEWVKLEGARASSSTSSSTGDTGRSHGDTPDPDDVAPVYDPNDIDEQDFILGALRDLGRIKSGPRVMAAGTGWDIECPWIEEHTGRGDTGTAYFRGGGFKCHHGHCQDRGPMDLWAGVNALLDEDSGGLDSLEQRAFGPGTWPAGTVLKKPLRASPPGQAFAQELAEAHVYMATEDAIVRRRSGRAVALPAFDRAWGDKLGPYGADVLPMIDSGRTRRRMRASEWYLRHPARQDVLGAAWSPGRGEVVPDPADPSVNLLNTWRPWPRVLAGMGVVDEARVAPWLRLVDHVFPLGHGTVEDPGGSLRELVLDWMAMMLGEPSVKPGWHVLLTGEQGIGKDFVTEPLKRLMEGSVSTIGSHDLGSQFTGWAKARLVLGQEIKQTGPGTATGHDQYAKLKMFTANGEQWLDVNGKYQRREKVANVCGFWLTSNETVPLPIEKGDRRFLVFASPAKPWPGQEYVDLAAWLLAQGGVDLVGEFLCQRWETMDAARRTMLVVSAPMTPGRADLAQASSSPVGAWLEDMMGRTKPDPLALPDVVTAHEVVDAMARASRHGGQGLAPGVRVPSAQVMAGIMRGAGCMALNQKRPVRHRNGGPVRVVWSLRNHDTYCDMAHDQLLDVLDAQARDAAG